MRYYESVAGQDLADEFYCEFRNYIQQVSQDPKRYSERKGFYRRVNLTRFPYNYLFRVREDHIRILVIRHHRRKPNFGTRRK